MTSHDAAEDERSRLHGIARAEDETRRARAHERRVIAALIGPGHNYDLAPDAPLGSDPRLDQTGFAPGALL